MISNLQFLRAFASIAIVFYHTGYFLNGIHTEFGGVAIFFCLSGFMMTYVSRKGTDGFLLNRLIRIVPMYWCATSFLVVWLYSGLGDPVWNWPLLLTPNPRLWFGVGLLVVCGLPFLRIFRSNAWRLDLRAPRRWLVLPLLFVAAGFSMLYGFAGAGQDAVHFMKSLLFIPYVGVDGGTQPMLGVGWTLNIEILLYVLFSVCLLLNQRWAPSLVVAAIVGAELLGRLMEVPILL
ncbi:acyltransferase family protein [Herbaspirillum aquaticum]|uniref:acyltransferase family protein n=1 Tax=Herbaspirillum aquaticum TaxID=568783 RepID=UPI0024DEEF09|nr:acyltransferase family protein [Herbaspirillum aquaticum]